MKNQVAKPTNTIKGFLESSAFQAKLRKVLPEYLTPDRLVGIALTEVHMNPKLLECDPTSFAGAIMRCALIGLEPSSERQHVYLIPFRNNSKNRTECQVVVGYRGFLSLASRSNVYIESDVVYENDEFEFQKGLDTRLRFCPALNGDRGAVKGAYAMARVCLPNGDIIFVPEFIPKSDLDKIKNSSKSISRSDSPWHAHYEAMCRKSAIRRLFKYLPLNEKIDAAVTSDELSENDSQENMQLVEDIFVNIDEDQEVKTKSEELADKLELKGKI